MPVKDNSFGIAPLQDKMLGALKYFISLCEEYGLRYCVFGGTCIGVLRHHGFIPWDDDLDVCMPRPDYEKLWRLCGAQQKDGKYRLCRSERGKNYHNRVMRMVDLETTFINKRAENEDIEHGVYIDIIPLDVCPSGAVERACQIVNSVIFSVYNVSCLPELHGGWLMRTAVRTMLFLIRDDDRRYKIWKRAEKRMTAIPWDETSRLVELTTNFEALCAPYPREWFLFDDRKARFEDIDVCIPTKAEEYLTEGFGDYMKLPPEEKRSVRHNTVFVDLNNSYRIYKGKYYCVSVQ